MKFKFAPSLPEQLEPSTFYMIAQGEQLLEIHVTNADASAVRRVPLNAGATTWADITDKPATFTPSTHTHDAGDITSGILADARIPALDATKAQVLNGNNNRYVSGGSYINVISWNDMGTVSASTSINLNTSLNHKLNVTANITLDATNVTPGKSGDIVITTPSVVTVSWAAKWKFLGSVPNIGDAGKTWVVSYKVYDANTIYASAVKVA